MGDSRGDNIYMFDGHNVVERRPTPLWWACLVSTMILTVWGVFIALGVLFWWPLLVYSWSYWFG